MKCAWRAVAVLVVVALSLGVVSGAEGERISARAFGLSYEILEGLELDAEVLKKADALFQEAGPVYDTLKEATDRKKKDLNARAKAASKKGDKKTASKLRAESKELGEALTAELGKRMEVVLALLPDDETRAKAKAGAIFLVMSKNCHSTTPMFELELSAKQIAAMHALCLEVVKAEPDLKVHHRPSMLQYAKSIGRDALTKVLGPHQAVEAYKKLTKQDKRAWPPEDAPKPDLDM